MSLLSLPPELLCQLPNHLDNIESFTSAASTCRTLRAAFLTTSPSTILRLAAASAPAFFSPHPYFLIAATAHSASSWALGHQDRTNTLRHAFQGGIDALYTFCLEHGSLTLPRIRQTHLLRFSTINPLADKIDKMAGRQWSDTPDFWDGGVSEAVTLYTDADRAAFQLIIYGELFGTSMDAFLSPEQNLPAFDVDTRLDYLTYSLPDEREPNRPDSGRFLAPYYEDQRCLRHIVRCGRWRRLWAGCIREFLDEGFGGEEGWREKLLRDALLVQGLEGMELVTRKPGVGLSGQYLERARGIRDRVNRLDGPPGVRMLGKKGVLRVSEAPDIVGELDVCFWGEWR
ncbi:hypothetical protein BDW62DRAFT_52761 [Aspergillus aurantiobrunneus]